MASMLHSNLTNSTILIVDDTPTNLRILVDYLENHSHRIVISQDGESALKRAKLVVPDIILLDVIMPGMDGFEVCRLLKENPETRDIPVVFMTVLSETVDKVKGFDLGAVDYITKPFHCEEILVRIDNHLTIRHLQKQLEKSNKNLGELVAEQTSDLQNSNTALLSEITKCKQTEEKLKWESAVNQVLATVSGELLSSAHSLKKLADLVLCNALKLTNSVHGFASVIDSRTKDLVNYSYSTMLTGESEIINPPMRIPFGPEGNYKGPWGNALNTMKSSFVNTLSNHDSFNGFPDDHIAIDRYLAVPIIVEGKPAGLIALANASSDYTDKDVKTIEQLGELYGVAIQQQLFEAKKEDMEKQIQQMQKMEAIGTLSGGIAHDFNNLLHPILGYASMGIRKTDEAQDLHKFFQAIQIAGNRAKELVKQILTFSRQSDQKLELLILQPIIKEALKFLRSSLPTTIEIKQDIETNSLMVMANAIMIHQIIMNLVTNAYNAMQTEGGILEVSLRSINLDPIESEKLDLPTGAYIRLTISDTGVGMSPDVQERIFEPYFTTKDKGKGTGLGLSVVLGAVKSHHGSITVSSSQGRGSVFKVYLPQITEEKESREQKDSLPIVGGNESILLVDDEISVIHLEKSFLEGLGYRVSYRTDSVEALKLFKSSPEDFDLVVTDLTMPVMTGDRLAKNLISIKPGIPVILCTGFSERMDQEKAMKIGVKNFLNKPISLDQFAHTIRSALEDQ